MAGPESCSEPACVGQRAGLQLLLALTPTQPGSWADWVVSLGVEMARCWKVAQEPVLGGLFPVLRGLGAWSSLRPQGRVAGADCVDA